MTAPVAINPTPTEAVAPIPVITIEGVSLPGGSGSQPLSVSKDISEEISSLMTNGISTDTSKAISGEFPLEFVDAEFSLKPPKLDGWISRRALLKTDKSIVRSINAAEESFTKAQLRIMDIAPPLIDLYARLNSLPDSESLKRPVQAALQQWGRAFFHVTKERRSAAIALAEPGAEYLLRDPDAFESGKEARSFLFTERYLQAMLTDANQDNTLAQAARAAAAAAAARVPKRSNPKRGRVDQPGSQFPPPRYGTDQMSRGGRGGRGRSDRGRGQPANPWLQGGRRYVAQNSKHLPPCKTAPQSHLVPHAQTKVPSNPVDVSWPHTGPQAVAARLKLFAARWSAVTSDQWVLEAVREGITIDFVSKPIQKFLPPQITMSVEMSAVCDAEVRELLSKRAISEVTDGSSGFVCSFFCIKKKQPGQFRPIVNLKPLNKFIRYQHFKMENLESVRFLVRKGDWLAKVDLKDAYFTVAVKKSHHKFLRFRWKDRVFEFNCMAFGLAPAPRIFTKILKTVMAFLRRQGIRLVIYLDDILILNESKSGLEADINTVIDLLQSLGFLINWEKSIVVPTQTIFRLDR